VTGGEPRLGGLVQGIFWPVVFPVVLVCHA
jgi:hypothetical protein